MDSERKDGVRSSAPNGGDGNSILELVRAKLARDLHDGVGQSLNTLLIRIRLAIAQGEAGMDDLKRFELTAQQALAGARAVAYGLRQAEKADRLADAYEYAQRILTDAGCTLFWADERTYAEADGVVLQELALAIQESVTNIARHASAAAAWIRLEDENGSLRVSIRDNGVGFVLATVDVTPDGRGLGLLGNVERLAALGGSFHVRSTPGEGTVVVLEAPHQVARSSELNKARRPSLLDIQLLEPAVAAAG